MADFAAPNTPVASSGKLGAQAFQASMHDLSGIRVFYRSDVVSKHKCRKARVVTRPRNSNPFWQASSNPHVGISWTGRSITLHERMTQIGTPPPIRTAGTGFRGPGNMRKSQCPADRTQVGRPEFPASVSRIGFLSQLRTFDYVNAVEKVDSEIAREQELPTADIPGSMM